MAVFLDDYLESILGYKRGEDIEDMFDLTEDGTFPSFLGIYMEKGALIILSCLDDATKRRLETMLPLSY